MSDLHNNQLNVTIGSQCVKDRHLNSLLNGQKKQSYRAGPPILYNSVPRWQH